MSRAARPSRIFSTTGSAVFLAVCVIVTVALLVDAAVRSGAGNALLLAPWLLLVLWGVYVIGIASDVRADRSGVQVQNLLRRTRAPWARVQRVAMRWQLELTLDDGSVLRCLGSPAHSRPRRLAPGRVREDAGGEAHDGLARLRKLRTDAAADDTDAAVTRTWDFGALVALLVIAVWAVIAVVVTR